MEIPTRIDGNIAWIEGQPWAFYRVAPFSYTPLSVTEKEAALSRGERFYRHLQQSGYHAQLWMVRRRFNWMDYLDRLVDSVELRNQEAAREAVDYWRYFIQQTPIMPDYDWVVAIELPRPIVRKYRWLTQTFGMPVRMIEQVFGLMGKTVFKEQEDAELQEKSMQDRINGLVPVVPMASAEIADFYRHHFYRGMNMPPLPQTLRKRWMRGHQDYTWLAEGLVRSTIRSVQLVQNQQTRWCGFVTVAALPDEMSIPGHELFYRLSSELDFPIEATVRWMHISSREALRRVRRKKLDVKDATSHIGEVDEIPWSLQEQRELADGLEYHIQHERPPLLESRIVFAVDAADEDTLSDQIDQLIDLLDDYGVVAACPMGDQERIFESWLPSSKWTGYGYKLNLLPEVAAAIALPGASDLLGDPNGMPVGFTRRGSIVKLDLGRGPQINKNASMVLVGPLGSGKSFTLNTLIHNAGLYWGARIFVVDPKGERSHWPGNLPGLEDQVRLLILDGRKNPGALDPFRIMPDDPEAASEIAVSILGGLLGAHTRDEELPLLEAATAARQSGNPSIHTMCEALKDIKNGAAMAAYLEHIAKMPLGKLLFGEGDGYPIPDSGIVILQLAGLKLPSNGRAPSNLVEKVSVSVMAATALLAESFILRGKKGGLRFAALDEAWMWLRTAEGKTLADRLERAGRSANSGVWISTQNPSDLSADLLNNIGLYICLGTDNEDEARIAASALGLQPTDELLKELQTRKPISGADGADDSTSGVGYMRDLDGRAGWIQFYTPDVRLRELFNTKPEAVAASKVFSAGGM